MCVCEEGEGRAAGAQRLRRAVLHRAPDELVRVSAGDEEHLVLLGDGQRRLALLREAGQDLDSARHRPLQLLLLAPPDDQQRTVGVVKAVAKARALDSLRAHGSARPNAIRLNDHVGFVQPDHHKVGAFVRRQLHTTQTSRRRAP